LADRSTHLIASALARAAGDSSSLLLSSKGEAGLFPPTAAAKLAARRCLDEGLLRIIETAAGKPPRERVAITEKGLDWLRDHSNPRNVLNDLVRVLETRYDQLENLVETARQMQVGLETMKDAVSRIIPLVAAGDAGGKPPRNVDPVELSAAIQTRLEQRHVAGACDDCPLPELYRRVAGVHPAVTIGAFHDVLRTMHDGNLIYLHPWTGPLYEMPEPPFALLIGHEIAYYASPRLAPPTGPFPPAALAESVTG
jgi:hypothetical protein